MEEENVDKKSSEEEEKIEKIEKIPTESPEEEVEDFKNKYLRLLAELENTRKRMQKENQQTIRFAVENAIGEFIPIIDSFEKALKCAETMSDEVKNWASGFQMFLSQFKEVLHNHGIIAFHSKGNTFDPHYHEAVETIETNEHPEGIILEEFSKGYKSAFRTIRPSRVKVTKAQMPLEEEKVTKGEINE